MAYSRVRVQFEIGHEASLRTKKTPEGFTHDWEVFVRGADNADIQHFVEKVVFHLHGTFPKPRRTYKEPPYCVKESGYAGFNLPIDIYLKNNNPEQRKIRFYYDLTLQDSGAPVSHLVREEASFTNPAEDFRRKLLMGGGVGVGSDVDGNLGGDKTIQNHSSNSLHADDSKLSHVSKPKLSSSFSDSQKKHKSKDSSKSEELRGSNSFAALFGAPIRTGKHSPKTSSSSSYSKNSSSTTNEQKTSSHEKQGKESSSKPPKHSPHKDREKDKESSVVKKDKDPDRSISKEKERRDGSHKEKDRSKEKSKRTSSPFLPTSSSIKPPEPPKKEENKKEESPVKKHSVEEVKEKAPTPKTGETVKTEKKHKEKKNREDRERKEGHKEKEHHKKEEKEKNQEKPVKKIELKDVVKEVKPPKPVEKEEKKMKVLEKEKEKERLHDKHKHKKKDKHKKDEERERLKKKEAVVEKPPEIKRSPVKPRSPSPPKISRSAASHPLNTLIEQMKDSADSDSEMSAIDETPLEAPPTPRIPTPPLPSKPPKTEEKKPEMKEEKKFEMKEERKIKKEKKSRDEEGRDVKKRKRKLKDREEPSEKYIKMEIKEEKSPSIKREARSPSSHRFTEDYVTQLKDLQHKIMTLQDNDDLQRVVQVISETGQFEITQRTFDFDLCALDRSTVKRLQDMFILS